MVLLESAPATADPAVSQAAAAAGVVGGIIAFSLTAILIFELVWFILQYDICWSGLYGLLFMVTSIVGSVLSSGEGAPTWKVIVAGICGIIALILHIVQSFKLSSAFGHGIGMGLVLIILGPIGRIILGFGGSEYVGKD